MPMVLIVEDEPAIAELIAVNLRHNGFQPVWAEDGASAQRELDAVLPDVILLDWMLPGASGLSLARKWRADSRTKTVPILMLTARGDEPDKVAGLDAGADDYLIKPIDLHELAARLRALVRRAHGQSETRLVAGNVALDPAAHQVLVDGQPVELSNREYDLLHALLLNAGRVLSREQLEQRLYQWGSEINSNAVEVHIYHLRRKLGAALIETVRGVGYRIAREPA